MVVADSDWSAQRRGEQPRASECEPAVCSTAKLGSDQHARPGTRPPSVNDLIGALYERRRDRQPDRLRGSEIDNQLELRGLRDREVGRLGALQDLVHEGGGTPVHVKEACAVGHETASLRVLPHSIDRWQAPLYRELCDLSSLTHEDAIRENEERACPLLSHRREGAVNLLGTPRLQSLKPHPQGPSCRIHLSQEGSA